MAQLLLFILVVMMTSTLLDAKAVLANNLEDEARKTDTLDVYKNRTKRSSMDFHQVMQEGFPLKIGTFVIPTFSSTLSLLMQLAKEIVDVNRVCLISIKNMGNRRLVDPHWYMSDGIIQKPLSRILEPREAGLFAFKKSSGWFNWRGTTGVLTYTISGTPYQVAVYWSVPWLYLAYSNEYNVQVVQDRMADESLLKSLSTDKNKQIAKDSGHWLTSFGYGMTVNAAMTNGEKAALQVEIE